MTAWRMLIEPDGAVHLAGVVKVPGSHVVSKWRPGVEYLVVKTPGSNVAIGRGLTSYQPARFELYRVLDIEGWRDRVDPRRSTSAGGLVLRVDQVAEIPVRAGGTPDSTLRALAESRDSS